MPSSFIRPIARMVSTLSSLAGPMKPQVFTTMYSASSGVAARSQPAWFATPSITSVSTRFFGQPREMK